MHIGKLPVAIPELRESLDVSLVQAGFLLSMVQLAGMSLGLLVGLGADRIGARRVMQVGLLLLALASALGATAQQVQWLLATRALEGLGFLLSVLPAPALLRQRVTHPQTLSKALGWWGAYMPLGTAIALLAGTAPATHVVCTWSLAGGPEFLFVFWPVARGGRLPAHGVPTSGLQLGVGRRAHCAGGRGQHCR